MELAPSQYISPLPHTKGVCLSLPPPQMLLMSSLTPPTLSSRCSCLPRRKKASPFTAQIEKVRRRNALVSAISTSSDRSWPRLPSCGLATCTLDLARWTIKVWVAAETSLKAPTTSPSTFPTDASFLSSFSVLLDGAIMNF